MKIDDKKEDNQKILQKNQMLIIKKNFEGEEKQMTEEKLVNEITI